VWLPINTEVLVETIKRVSALLAEDARRYDDLSVEKPAAELDARRPAIEWAPKDGAVVPTIHQHVTKVATRSGPKARRPQMRPEMRATPGKLGNALAESSTKPRAGRPRRIIPWLDSHNVVFYINWRDETKKPPRIRRRSTRTRDPEKAKKWYV
jgi:hypothetical protein